MRTSFHHQPEAQHPNFPLSTSWQADYPICWHKADTLDALLVCLLSGAKWNFRFQRKSGCAAAAPWCAIIWVCFKVGRRQ